MINIELQYRNQVRSFLILNEWDVDPDEVSQISDIRQGILRKYVMFNDGSRWIALLFGRIRDIIITSIGRYNINDIVCFSMPKFYDTYSGVLGEELDERVSPLSVQSQLKIRDFLHGIDVRLTMKEISNATKSLKQSLSDNEVNINFIIEKLKNEVLYGSAASRMYALRVLSGFVGLSFDERKSDPQTPLFGNPSMINDNGQEPISIPYQEVKS